MKEQPAVMSIQMAQTSVRTAETSCKDCIENSMYDGCSDSIFYHKPTKTNYFSYRFTVFTINPFSIYRLR